MPYTPYAIKILQSEVKNMEKARGPLGSPNWTTVSKRIDDLRFAIALLGERG